MKKLVFAACVAATMIACNDKSLLPTEENTIQHSNARPNATGQGIMVDFEVDANYVITEEVTYHFDKGAAAGYFTQSVSGPVVNTGTGATQPTPAQPAAENLADPGSQQNNQLMQRRCTFYNGGTLTGWTYTKTVNGTRGWRWTWTYTVTPSAGTVQPKTAWTSTVTQPGSNPVVPINAYIAGLSVLSSNQHPSKASFTLMGDDGITSRVQNLVISVDGTPVDTVGSTIINGTDFFYQSNAGTNGNTSLLTPYENKMASEILTSDSFGANNDIANAICAKMDQVVTTLGEGSHTVTLTGTVKGNAASADVPISVTKTVTINGGCNN
jgi:hypothetical protein